MARLDLKNPVLLRNVLCILLGLGALAVYFLTHFLPFGFKNRSEKIAVLKAEYEKKSTELARAKASVADLPRFEAEYEMLHARWSAAAELLPIDRQNAGLLRKITLAGQQTGVSFVLFRPAPTKDQVYYTELPVEVMVQGRYHQVGSFLAELANMRRIVTVSTMKLSVANPNDLGATTAASFNASAYSLNSAPSPQPAPAKGPAPSADAKKGDGKNANQES